MSKRKAQANSQQQPENTLSKVSEFIRQAAFKFDKKPCDVSSAEFWSVADGKVPEWQVRKLGGFTNIRGVMYPPKYIAQKSPAKASKKIKINPFPKLEHFKCHDDGLSNIFKLCGLKHTDVLRIVVQPDTHCPDHDEPAINSFCQFLKWYKPHGLINLGDFLEMEAVAHWPATHAEPRRLVPDIKVSQEVLSRIGAAAGPQCRYKRFLIGNHEYWLEQYLVNRIPEVLDGLEELGADLTLNGLMRFEDYGYETVPLNEILRVGDLHFIHGYYTGKHHAAKHLSVFGVNLMYGHLHDVQSHSEVSVKGLHEAMSLGCLRTMNARFLKGKPNNWSHSFAIVEMRHDGHYTRYMPIIVEGKFTFNGVMFDGSK